MRQETVTYDIYKFNELNPKVQTKVLDNNRLWNVEHFDWSEYTLDHWKEKLEEKGFVEAKIWFSGFSCQGDGACFDAYCDLAELVHNNLDTNKYRRLLTLIDDGQITASIGKTSYANHYNHQRTRYIELEHPFWSERCPKATKLCKELQEDIEELRYDLSCQIYKTLEEEYTYLISDEAVKESIEANEIEFKANGDIY